MKTASTKTSAVAIFGGLAIVSATLLLVGAAQHEYAQQVVVALGGAVFAAGLTVFLLRMTEL